MSKNIFYCLLLLIAITVMPACKKGYLDRFPLSGPSSASFYTNEDELMMGLMGCYSQLNFGNSLRLPMHIIFDATTDISWERTNGDLQDLAKGNHDVNNDITTRMWSETYQGIGRCNFLLDNIDKLQGVVPDNVLNQSRAEARFIRALHYHYLTAFYGAVPLITTTLELSEAQVPKTSKTEIVDFILQELTESVADLPLNQAILNNGRATKGAALAIKSRAALYDERWEIAAQAAQELMNLNKYELHNSFANLFTYDGQAVSKEIIISLQYLVGINTHTTPRYFLPRMPGGVCDKVPFQSFVDSYEMTDGLSIDKSPLFNPDKPFDNRDPRLGYTVALPGTVLFGYLFESHKDSLQTWNYNLSPPRRVSNTEATHAFATFTGYIFRKYMDMKDVGFLQQSQMPIILARYAEVLLNYAEAKVELNQIDQSVYDAINEVRQRDDVNMPPITTGKTQQELRAAIRRERKYEFAMEGLRLPDLRRWGLADDILEGPFYGRVLRGFLSNAPVVDEYATPHYDNVANAEDMRLIETKIFNEGRDNLWPIPGIEILANKNLEQNPGY